MENKTDLTSPLEYSDAYIKNHLIAYIGNKRRLVPLIDKALKEVEENGSFKVKTKGRFLDLFAGSGVVSRLAKERGYEVIANDWETYSYIINRAFVEYNKEDLKVFDDEGGIDVVLDQFNALKSFSEKNSYISKYYCPRSDEKADPDHERLFYTRQNGVLLDNIRTEIEKRYGNHGTKKSVNHEKKKMILLSLLIYEASLRSNTSGVFKAFHHGFGGKGRDALSRILAPVRLTKPVLSSVSNASKAVNMDAYDCSLMFNDIKADVVYLDPPYNQHQYGSNYHLLNTIARGDRPSVNKSFNVNGKKVNKSAIRKDWVRTKSPFCYKKEALGAFKKLIEVLNTRYILLSYSTEGIMSIDDILGILAEKGRPGIVTTGYVRYRGGRQAHHTKNKNIEYVITVDTGRKCRKQDLENIRDIIAFSNNRNALEETYPLHLYHPDLKSVLVKKRGMIEFEERVADGKVELLFKGSREVVSLDRKMKISESDRSRFVKLFKKNNAMIKDYFNLTVSDEIKVLLKALRRTDIELDRTYMTRRIMTLYKKINPVKTPEICKVVTDLLIQARRSHLLAPITGRKEKMFIKQAAENASLLGMAYPVF